MNSSLLFRALGALALVIAVGGVVFGMNSARKSQELEKKLEELKNNPQQATQDEVQKLVEETGKLIVLPEGETPTVASITDREKLKDVPFFAKAENGDKVLIYVNARKAFLYRPGTKLIEVATINLTPRADQGFAAKVALRNSTEVAGLTKRVEDELKRLLPKVEITARGNAKAAVEKTLVVDLSGSRKADAERLATIVGGTVGELPKGEAKPVGADFLILLGKDKAAAGSPSPSPSPGASPGGSPSPSPSPSPTS